MWRPDPLGRGTRSIARPIDGSGRVEGVFDVEQPDGHPLSIETIRATPQGLLVVAQACGVRQIVRKATFVHLSGIDAVGGGLGARQALG